MKNFERCATVDQAVLLSDLFKSKNAENEPERSVQFMADNVDHQSCTLNRKDTFHGMGIMATFIPGKFRENKEKACYIGGN